MTPTFRTRPSAAVWPPGQTSPSSDRPQPQGRNDCVATNGVVPVAVCRPVAELPLGRELSLSEIRVQALIRPVYQGDGCGRSRDAPVVPTPPPARILPGSGCSPVGSTR